MPIEAKNAGNELDSDGFDDEIAKHEKKAGDEGGSGMKLLGPVRIEWSA